MRHAESASGPCAVHPRRRDRATHRGSCQVCGRLQKLPAGYLSKHGYTKRWGFFEGTCPGANYKPFEQAFDRVQDAIYRTNKQIQALRELVETLQGPIEGDQAPFQAYDSFVGYYETQVTVTLVDGHIRLTEPATPNHTGKIHWGTQYGCHGTIEQAIRKLRESRIQRITTNIEHRIGYVQWQESRINSWKPGTLTPVKEAA